MNTLAKLLADQPFWNGLPPQYFAPLAELASIQEFRPKEKIFIKGHDAENFYLLTKGEVTLETPFVPGEGVISVQSVSAGEPLGWSWLFPPFRWHFSVRAIEHSTAIVFDAIKLRKFAEENPAFGYDLALRVGSVLTQRLQSTRARLINICEVA